MMDDKKFREWFFEHVDDMVANGIMHPDSQAGKWIKLALTASHSHYEKRLNELENRIRSLEGLGPKPVELLVVEPIKKIQEPKVKKEVVKKEPAPKKVPVKQQWL